MLRSISDRSLTMLDQSGGAVDRSVRRGAATILMCALAAGVLAAARSGSQVGTPLEAAAVAPHARGSKPHPPKKLVKWRSSNVDEICTPFRALNRNTKSGSSIPQIQSQNWLQFKGLKR